MDAVAGIDLHRQLQTDRRTRLSLLNFPCERMLKIGLRMKYRALLSEGFQDLGKVEHRTGLLALALIEISVPRIKAHRVGFRIGPTSGTGRGCVKTWATRECAELFSPFPPSTATASAVLFLFNVIETKFLRESSASEFSHSLGQSRRFDGSPLRPARLSEAGQATPRS